MITFKNCKVTHFETVLFDPSWGVYDMAIGKNICSAFAGPADSNSFEDIYTISKTKTAKVTYTEKEKQLHQLYETVKNYRIKKTIDFDVLADVVKDVQSNYPSEWLILLELYELVYDKDLSLMNGIYEQLLKLKQNKKYTKLIADGLDLIIKK